MPFSCYFCEVTTEVKDLNDSHIECLKCHNITLHPREHNKLINTDIDDIEFTRMHYPYYAFHVDDTKFVPCLKRVWCGDGLWCNKFKRPCIGSCEWKRERVFKRQADITEWFN